MTLIYTYVTSPTGMVHLRRRNAFNYAVCGRNTDGWTVGDESITGNAATCSHCRKSTPAGRADATPTTADRRTEYRQAALRHAATVLEDFDSPAAGMFGLTEDQAAGIRRDIAKVLRHRADNHRGRVRI